MTRFPLTRSNPSSEDEEYSDSDQEQYRDITNYQLRSSGSLSPIRHTRTTHRVSPWDTTSRRRASLGGDNTLPPALHPCRSASPSHRRSATSPTPTASTSTPPPPSPSLKSEPSPSTTPVDVESYHQKSSNGKSVCIWQLDGAEGGICGFESSGSLVKRHIRTVHLKIRPVTCPVCGQGFSTKFHLKTHSNIHTGQKPYDCPDCGKKFSNPSSKHHHRVRYHGYVQSWRHYKDDTSNDASSKASP